MPRLAHRNPSYRRHRVSGQAVVTIDGNDVYLGPYGSKASKDQYDRLIGEWLANGRRLPAPNGGVTDLAVAELVEQFLVHADGYYRKADGTPTTEPQTFRSAVRLMLRLYAALPVAEFSPLKLAAVRDAMIAKGWSRKHVNGQVARLKMVFKWGLARELVPAAVHQALTAVGGLRANRSSARESDPVRPVPIATVEQTLSHLSRTVAAMVGLQLATGARPGEICGLRTGDVDRTGDVWTCRLSEHKTAHHGHGRTLHVGPRGQAVLLPFLDTADPAAFVFSPAKAERERLVAVHAARRTPLTCGNRPGSNRRQSPKRQPGDRYDVASYRRAIARACDAAFPPPASVAQRPGESLTAWRERLTPEQRIELARWQAEHRWHPHQVRHTVATEVRRQFGLDVAGTVLGHRGLAVTQVYAERDAAAAKRVAAAIG